MPSADVLAADPPSLTLPQAVEIAQTTFGVSGTARILVSERDQNFAISTDAGSAWVLKVSNAAEDPAVIDMEVAAISRVASADPALPVPLAHPTFDGEAVGRVEVASGAHLVRLIPLMPGRNVDPVYLDPGAIRGIGEVVARVAHALRGFFHPAAGRVILWDQQHLPRLMPHAALVGPSHRRELLDRVLHRLGERVLPALPMLRSQVIHNDMTLDNLLLDESGKVTGIIDFGDMAHTALVLDIPATLQSLLRGRDDPFTVAATFLAGYTSVVPLEDREAELLGDLLAGRMAQTILISAFRTRKYPNNEYIRGWSEPAWTLLDQMASVGFDEVGRRLAAAARAPVQVVRTGGWIADDELIDRRRVLGSALEPLAYRQPLHLVRGDGSWMYDTAGRGFLDAYNNVPVVGHSHPRVVEAVTRQAATLTTNTRYLHESVIELAERLTSLMPAGLDTVMFVNSGSEANDLAWRLARSATGGDTGIVTDWAYHGVTAAIADFSPSEWPRGRPPASVETIAAPNTYRGAYADAADPAAFAQDEISSAIERIAARDRTPAALYLDATFTADGIFVPSALIVRAIVTGAREAGGLYVADEVQSGYGRTGDGLWGFSAWDVVPDFVTLGKPMGNGYPVAAVITRAAIVDRFAAESSFFSTFGGNPVACAAALAVLDVIESQGLIANAASVGSWLRTALAELGERHKAIGDIRGRGLMLGVELIEDGGGRQPARVLGGRVRDTMRERGVLIGTTGRAGNVLKIRPPLSIRRDEAELIVKTLDEVLTELRA